MLLEQEVPVKKLIEALGRVQGQGVEHITVYELLHILPSEKAAQHSAHPTPPSGGELPAVESIQEGSAPTESG